MFPSIVNRIVEEYSHEISVEKLDNLKGCFYGFGPGDLVWTWNDDPEDQGFMLTLKHYRTGKPVTTPVFAKSIIAVNASGVCYFGIDDNKMQIDPMSGIVTKTKSTTFNNFSSKTESYVDKAAPCKFLRTVYHSPNDMYELVVTNNKTMQLMHSPSNAVLLTAEATGFFFTAYWRWDSVAVIIREHVSNRVRDSLDETSRVILVRNAWTQYTRDPSQGW